uniref:D-isomer specific 2-hydroxyacid dehydrogenase NAD-binding domain-containing protein n=1 Tax=Ditylenchus dipsaci TaxID=166011 RepID=A0A915EB71_9BILA
MGRIGMSVAEKLWAFHPSKVIYHNRRPKTDVPNYAYVSFEELIVQSDFLIITASAGAETYGLFNQEAFAKMKNDAILVNVSRGKVVDTADLVNALKNGQLGAAGLDVTDPEPLPLDHPLFQLTNCVVAPHIGSANYTARNRMLQLGEENVVAAVLDQEMPSPLIV